MITDDLYKVARDSIVTWLKSDALIPSDILWPFTGDLEWSDCVKNGPGLETQGADVLLTVQPLLTFQADFLETMSDEPNWKYYMFRLTLTIRLGKLKPEDVSLELCYIAKHVSLSLGRWRSDFASSHPTLAIDIAPWTQNEFYGTCEVIINEV